jgi:hypothetical protein
VVFSGFSGFLTNKVYGHDAKKIVCIYPSTPCMHPFPCTLDLRGKRIGKNIDGYGKNA